MFTWHGRRHTKGQKVSRVLGFSRSGSLPRPQVIGKETYVRMVPKRRQTHGREDNKLSACMGVCGFLFEGRLCHFPKLADGSLLRQTSPRTLNDPYAPPTV